MHYITVSKIWAIELEDSIIYIQIEAIEKEDKWSIIVNVIAKVKKIVNWANGWDKNINNVTIEI
jgi:hypothetical protein